MSHFQTPFGCFLYAEPKTQQCPPLGQQSFRGKMEELRQIKDKAAKCLIPAGNEKASWGWGSGTQKNYWTNIAVSQKRNCKSKPTKLGHRSSYDQPKMYFLDLYSWITKINLGIKYTCILCIYEQSYVFPKINYNLKEKWNQLFRKMMNRDSVFINSISFNFLLK